MAAEEGLVEDSFEVPALLLPVRRSPGPEGRPPGEEGSSKSSCSQDLARNLLEDTTFCFLQFHSKAREVRLALPPVRFRVPCAVLVKGVAAILAH